MNLHFHNFGKWDDVKLGEEVKGVPMTALLCVVRQTIVQQRRCSICNLVQTRHS